MKRSTVSGIAAIAASLTLAVTAVTVTDGRPSAGMGLAVESGGSGASYIFGGSGRSGSTAAVRAYRDLLDHGPDAKLLTVAHRGQWRDAPENSLASFRAAFDDGAEIIETDIQLTEDGVPVLMHDTTVDRTTNGTGAVSGMTFAQIRQLRLREGLGGGQAALTDAQVPTLDEAMRLAKNRGLVNLDKGWQFREEIWQVLVRTGTVRNGIYKSDAPVPEVQAFRSAHDGAVYMHIVTDANLTAAAEFGDDQPVAYEVNYDSVQDAVARRPFLDSLAEHSRVWNNTMWNGLADHMTDEASLTDPSRGWEALVRGFRTSVFQTDDVEKLESWLRTGEGDPLPRGGVRVQAEDFLPGKDKGYHDEDAGNTGGLKMRPGEDVDIDDADGNVRVGWMRGGEWLTYDVDIPRRGTYELSARVSSPYSPAGTYTLSFDGGSDSERVDVHNTTSHNKEVLQPSGVRQSLTAGRHTLRISLPRDAYQNWNLDYLQLAPVRD
ncbi:glycerophosphodiester phosphodiesterase family protein [Streptomyces sp. NPDC127072]|uniref:glycerophosphodiester phosphodiesterase family protein n=1 Tax=Streptomyces sp. NPDC127072 TaxID=3347129 RepID=UPI003667BF29